MQVFFSSGFSWSLWKLGTWKKIHFYTTAWLCWNIKINYTCIAQNEAAPIQLVATLTINCLLELPFSSAAFTRLAKNEKEQWRTFHAVGDDIIISALDNSLTAPLNYFLWIIDRFRDTAESCLHDQLFLQFRGHCERVHGVWRHWVIRPSLPRSADLGFLEPWAWPCL